MAALDAPVTVRDGAALAAANRAPDQRDARWPTVEIDPVRWSKLYPYQLLVLEAVPGPDDVTTYRLHPEWVYTLPYPPESWQKDRRFAILLEATNRGVSAQHSGLTFVPIRVSGTTGVLPLRGSAPQLGGFGPLRSIFAGTVQAAQAVQTEAVQTARSATDVPQVSPNVHSDADFAPGTTLPDTSGYAQTKRLELFLERYVEAKRSSANRHLRLAWAVWKDQDVWLVEPESLSLSKSADAPMEWRYHLELKAYRRVTIDAAGSNVYPSPPPIRRAPGLLSQVLNTVDAARRTLSGVSTVAAAVIGDVDRLITEPLRETSLFCKDLLGAKQSVADLIHGPNNVLRSAAASFVAAASQAIGLDPDPRAQTQRRAAYQASQELGVSPPPAPGTPGIPYPPADHPGAAPLLDPAANYALLRGVPIDSLVLTPAQRAALDQERARVRALTRDDFADRRDGLRSAADRLAAALGAGDPTWAATYRADVPRAKSVPSDADWTTLFALNDACTQLDHLAATADAPDDVRALDLIAQDARAAGIPFRVPQSKFAVPFPYGATLESIAQRYLGDAQRWLEIAALNGLRDPWVDETGWSQSLTVPPGTDHVVIPAAAQNLLRGGQTVYLVSSSARRRAYVVQGLTLTGDQLRVDLDGDPSAYAPGDGAEVQGFLPDTVNSQSLLYIPSDAEPDQDPSVTRAIPGVDSSDPLVAVAGVDFLLDATGDLVLTPDGQSRLVSGTAHWIQSVLTQLRTEKGGLLLHPQYGRPQLVGRPTGATPATVTVRDIRRVFADDPAVASVDAVRETKSGPTARIDAVVSLRGTDQPIPVTFHVERGLAPPSTD